MCRIQKHLFPGVYGINFLLIFYWIAPLSCLKLKIKSWFINQLSEQWKKEVAEMFLFMKSF